MLIFFLSLLAGFLAPYVEPSVRNLVEERLEALALKDEEYLIVALAAMLFGVVMLSFMSGLPAPAFSVILGGVIGLFGIRVFKALKRMADVHFAKDSED
jgi:hypothetical protein